MRLSLDCRSRVKRKDSEAKESNTIVVHLNGCLTPNPLAGGIRLR